MSVNTETQKMSSLNTGKIGLFIVLGSESVFFATLLVAYAALRDQLAWPLDHSFSRLVIPVLNTLVLLVSTLTARQALADIRKGNIGVSRSWQLVTCLLGLVFIFGQVFEFSHAGFQINDQAFGGVFFTLMGFHALHVLAGMMFLILNIIRTGLGDFSANRNNPVELATLFWYYVTAIWLVLFAALYFL